MDSEDFYHMDFTTASAVEIFISKIEQIFHDWELPRNSSEALVGKTDFNTGTWLTQSENITLVDPESVFERDIEFRLTRFALDCQSAETVEEIKDEVSTSVLGHDLLSLDNDFCQVCLDPGEGPHPLSRWYGLRDFVVLIPQNASNVDSVNKIKTLLSCLRIAVDNTECCVPVFVQCGAPWQLLFQGHARSSKLHTNFEMIHLERTPSHCRYLNGLVSLFKSKLGNAKPKEPITVSVRFTYERKEWTPGTWRRAGESEPLGGEFLTYDEIGSVPFGSRHEPVAGLILRTVWPRILEQSVVDGENYSDLDPWQAPECFVSVNTVDELSCLLSDHFVEFLSLVQKESRIMAVSRALSGLRGVPSTANDNAIPSDILMTLLYYLFPDADTNRTAPPYFSDLDDDPHKAIAEKHLKGIKSAPYDSLPWRLTVVMAHTMHSLGGQRAAEHLWNEFSQELVYRCEHNIPIPGLESGYPDPRGCLLYQKLQLLNCCITRRIDRDKRDRRPLDESDSEPEDFYDAEEVSDDGREEPKKISGQATGRLNKHGELLLLETGEPLYVPRTQDPVPHTEDQLEEHADILLQLGSGTEASALRASIMSASLLADMEAFKAGNPGSVLADFIRWFSPRDWIEDGEKDCFGQPSGYLSARMTLPGNTWQEVWDVARPVPARNQKRLFDDTKEMEKALMFLEVQTPKDFVTLLLPILTSCVLLRLYIEAENTSVQGVDDALSKLVKRVQTHSRVVTVVPKNFEEMSRDIMNIEKCLVHFKAIYNGFVRCIDSGGGGEDDLLKSFISRVVLEDNVRVPNRPSPIRDIVFKLLTIGSPSINQTTAAEHVLSQPNSFPSPIEKEIILRVLTNTGPQRLYAVLRKNECRISGAFSDIDMLN